MEVCRGVFARCLKRVAPIGATLFFKYILQDSLCLSRYKLFGCTNDEYITFCGAYNVFRDTTD